MKPSQKNSSCPPSPKTWPQDYRDAYGGMGRHGGAALISEYFDLRPGAIIRDLKLRQPIYRKTAAYGHFGRDDIEFPWERTDKAEALKSAAGL